MIEKDNKLTKVLLTGAGGVVGFAVLKELLEKKYQVTIIELKNKHNRKKLKPYTNQINLHWGCISDYDLISDLIVDQDVVIHLAAIIPPLADQKPDLTKKINYGGTKNIVDAITKYNPSCFMMFSSSISVYGDRVKDFEIKITDECKPSSGDYYAEIKVLTEELIKDNLENFTIYRLTGVMDKPKLDPLMFHMPLDTKLEIITAKDTALAFVNGILKKEELNQRIFNLGGGPNCRVVYRDFLKKCFSIYGLNYQYLNEDNFALKNFHCGYYMDNTLNKIVDFQKDTLEDYYRYLKKEVPSYNKFFAKVFSYFIIKKLNNLSEPKKAQKEKNKILVKRFYGKF